MSENFEVNVEELIDYALMLAPCLSFILEKVSIFVQGSRALLAFELFNLLLNLLIFLCLISCTIPCSPYLLDDLTCH